MEGLTRRRLSGAVMAVAVAIGCCAGVAHAKSKRVEQTGVFALAGGTPKIVSKFWTDHQQGLTATLKIRQFQMNGTTPILNYTMDMERLMHLVVVRDDFATFKHLHPDFDTTTGTFQQRFTKDAHHQYYVFADTTPQGIGQQVFRFSLPSAGAPDALHIWSTASAPTATAGPYTVTLAKTTLAANTPQKLDATIRLNGKPAPDLTTYLGAAGHAVFINHSTLSYVHVHPHVTGAHAQPAPTGNGAGSQMAMTGEPGPYWTMDLPPLQAGTYSLWLQFRNEALKVYTAPFTVVVQ